MEAIVTTEVSKIAIESIRAFTDYLKCREGQITERQLITGRIQTIIAQIESNKDNFARYMDKSFEERRHLYDVVEEAFNDATRRGDTDMAKITLNFMLNVYNKNPMDGYEVNKDYLSTDILKAIG